MVARITLTDRFCRSRKPAPPGRRIDYPDALVPGLAMRVTDKGHKSFVLVARYPLRPKNPTRRALGDYGALTLDKARVKARHWVELIGKGIDPKVEVERERAANRRRLANTWAAVVADFLEQKAKGLAKANEAKAILERDLGRRWGPRPIGDLTPLEISTAIRAIMARGAKYQAYNALGWVRSVYNWAIGTGLYGIESSPVDRLKPRELIGRREPRTRVLKDDELRLVWTAAGRLGKPYGPLIRLLILTGQRKNEIAQASWPEIEPAGWRDAEPGAVAASLVIPASRMKADAAHMVPLAPAAVEILAAIDAGDEGEFVFTTTDGEKPVNGFSKAKARLDLEIAKLRAEARAGEGAKPEKGDALPGWVLHDLRRTVRTHLSALPVQDVVREAVIAHARPGMHRVYDLHAYADEKRHALTLWAARLKGIVEPATGNVTPLNVPARGRA